MAHPPLPTPETGKSPRGDFITYFELPGFLSVTQHGKSLEEAEFKALRMAALAMKKLKEKIPKRDRKLARHYHRVLQKLTLVPDVPYVPPAEASKVLPADVGKSEAAEVLLVEAPEVLSAEVPPPEVLPGDVGKSEAVIEG